MFVVCWQSTYRRRNKVETTAYADLVFERIVCPFVFVRLFIFFFYVQKSRSEHLRYYTNYNFQVLLFMNSKLQKTLRYIIRAGLNGHEDCILLCNRLKPYRFRDSDVHRNRLAYRMVFDDCIRQWLLLVTVRFVSFSWLGPRRSSEPNLKPVLTQKCVLSFIFSIITPNIDYKPS